MIARRASEQKCARLARLRCDCGGGGGGEGGQSARKGGEGGMGCRAKAVPHDQARFTSIRSDPSARPPPLPSPRRHGPRTLSRRRRARTALARSERALPRARRPRDGTFKPAAPPAPRDAMAARVAIRALCRPKPFVGSTLHSRVSSRFAPRPPRAMVRSPRIPLEVYRASSPLALRELEQSIEHLRSVDPGARRARRDAVNRRLVQSHRSASQRFRVSRKSPKARRGSGRETAFGRVRPGASISLLTLPEQSSPRSSTATACPNA